MRTSSLLPSLFLLASLSLRAQDPGEIHGRAYEPGGGALSFANVTARQGERLVGTAADVDGRFLLKPLPAGTWTVEITSVGMEPKVITGVQVDPGRITFLNDQRLALNDTLTEATIIAYQVPLIKADDPTRMTLRASDLKHNPVAKNTRTMVSGLFPGVTAAPNGDGLYFRGSRTENMASYLDGVRIPGAVPSIPASAISSVSVYTGGLPAKYGDVTGGVVVIETKTYFEMYEERRAMEEALTPTK